MARLPRLARSSLAALSLVIGSAGCSPERVARPPQPPVDWQALKPRPRTTAPSTLTATERERAFAEAYLRALAAPDLAPLGALLDDEIHLRLDGSRDVNGRDAAVAAHAAPLAAIAERSLRLERRLLTAASQAVEWTMTGVSGPERAPISLRGLTLVWTRDDGTIADLHLYLDRGPPAAPVPAAAAALAAIEQQRSAAEAANLAVVRAQLSALQDGDEGAYLAPVAAEMELSGPAGVIGPAHGEGPAPLRGKAAARATFRALRRSVEYLATSVDNAWAIGPWVVLEYRIVGEQSRAAGRFGPAGDTAIKISLADLVELDGGRIVRVQRFQSPELPAPTRR